MSFKTSFQWFADFNTSTTGMQIIQFSAGGDVVRRRLAPMFAHYRKYKLGAIHVKFVPAATLPVDPTGLSYETGEQTVDPRDMFNPGLVRTTNGEDVFIPDETVLNSAVSDNLYYSTMLDRRWKKFRLQKGITLRAFPKFFGVANLRQNMFPGFVENIPGVVGSNLPTTLNGGIYNVRERIYSSGTGNFTSVGSSPMGLFQTGQKIPMGWMPTGASLKDEFGLLNGLSGTATLSQKYVVKAFNGDTEVSELGSEWDSLAIAEQLKEAGEYAYPSYTWTITTVDVGYNSSTVDAGVSFAPVPEIPGLLTLVLPRSFKTQFFYRVYVKEDVYFSDPVTSINSIEGPTNGTYFAPIDQFLRSKTGAVTPGLPDEAFYPNQNIVYNDGGNRGDTP